MKILSLNVNNFGGTNPKPLKKEPINNWTSWGKAVDEWHIYNKRAIQRNVNAIIDFSKDFDIIFLYEVDTNCLSWHTLLNEMEDEYELIIHNRRKLSDLNKNRKSISCAFVKKNIKTNYIEIYDSYRYVAIEVGNTYIFGLHMNYDLDDWDILIDWVKNNKDKEILIVGDLNVFDKRTDRYKKFKELLKEGIIDIWLKQGESNNVPTANTNERIDYALSTNELYEKGLHEVILNFIRLENYSDHAAIVVTYNDNSQLKERNNTWKD